jgi:2-dehydro-3-deoxyglucarate aldolase/4-hydroxy-2-oxoheptanedioate aldolase
MALHNSFKHALLNRERLVGAWFMSGSTVMAELVANAGYDFMVIDIEHSTASTHDLHALLQAVAESGTSPVVRMASQDKTQIKFALDMGALSLYFPMVNTVDDAVALARACRYPPFGDRGFARMHRASRYNTQPDYFERINQEVCVIAQLETPLAMANAMQIANVPGIDGLLVGPGDLSVALGHGGDVTHPQVKEMMEEVGGYCRRSGVPLGTVLPTPELVAWAYSIGFNFVSHASDLGLLMGASKTGIARIRELSADASMSDPPTISAPTTAAQAFNPNSAY